MLAALVEIKPNAVYTLQEVANALRVTPLTVRRWIKEGYLHGTRPGRGFRFLGSEILRALTEPQP
jgi:excisionase family DNA binding protein